MSERIQNREFWNSKPQKSLVGETKGKKGSTAILHLTSQSFPLFPFALRIKMPSEDSKPVKREGESNSKSSAYKKVGNSNAKVGKVKKEEAEPVKKEPKVKKEDIPLAKRTSNSKEVKKRKKIKEEEKKEEAKKKKEKKVYDLPGQRRDPPEEKDPLRVFYESLYNQVPNSEMSQIWMMESGLLPKDVAMKVFEKKQKRGLQKLSSPVKAVSAVKSGTKSVTVKKKSPTSPVPSSVKMKTTNSTSKQSKKRKSKDQSSEDDDDYGSDDEVIISVAKRRKFA
ncbi:hypothetical protein E2542_SST04017 [Spatholobus suberectus]|nr:hypothetical protein E2542_SST04017 [Spatholobus suberectus]